MADVTTLDLYHAIQDVEKRVGKLEARINYIFGGFAVLAVILQIIRP